MPFAFHMDSIDFLLTYFGYVVFHIKGLNFNMVPFVSLKALGDLMIFLERICAKIIKIA